ncbi:MAG: sugar phosphate isomerase/epimerase [Verrucomicrobiae bacterium]|nr:sugar phosphate isomerase/epimerase [Verrucomicrobiae bacterium]
MKWTPRLATLLLTLLPLAAADLSGQLGLQTWTLRNMDFDQMVAFAVRHGITNLQVIGKHIDPESPREEYLKKKEVLEANGLRAYTFGVAGTSLDKEKNRRLFEFAKDMGISLIIVEPGDFKILDNLEELAREYDIRVAIHNHGMRSLYGNPLVVRTLLMHRDPRMGVCMDAGWITSTGMQPAAVFRDYKGRVFDIHLKDKKVEKTQGDDVAMDTHIGEGQGNLMGLLEELQKSGWSGILAIETDSNEFARDPAEFVSRAKSFVAGENR